MTCLINQINCGLEADSTICTKCGLQTDVRYVSEADGELAISLAKERYQKAKESLSFTGAMEIIHNQHEKGLSMLRELVTVGDANAARNLGWAYSNGWWSVQIDMAEANSWFKRGADLGDAASMIHLALMYWGGVHTPRDFPATLQWLEKAYLTGDANAAVDLAEWHAQLRYESDSVLHERRQSSVDHTASNVERPINYAEAQIKLNEATQRLSKYSAPSDRVNVLLRLCHIFCFGPIELRNHPLAESLLELCLSEQWGESIFRDRLNDAMDDASRDHFLCLPKCYLLYLMGVEPRSLSRKQRADQLQEDIQTLSVKREPRNFFENKAALMEYATAGRFKDLALLDQLWRRAAELGSERAKLKVAYNLIRGCETARNPKKALKLYQELAEAGNVESMYQIGCILMKNELVPHQPAVAKYWFVKASENSPSEFDLIDLANYFLATEPMRAYTLLSSARDSYNDSVYGKSIEITLALMEHAGHGVKKNEDAAKLRLQQLVFGSERVAADQLEIAKSVRDACDLGHVHIIHSHRISLKSNALFKEWNERVIAMKLQVQTVEIDAVTVEQSSSLQDLHLQFQKHLQDAKAGISQAMLDLGWALIRGHGTPVDLAHGQQWLDSYCNAPDARARNSHDLDGRSVQSKHKLGIAQRFRDVAKEFQYASEIPNNLVLAAQWMNKASVAGDAEASFRLAVMYAEACGIAKDEASALRIFTLGIKQELGFGASLLLDDDGILYRFYTGYGWNYWRPVSAQTTCLGLRALAKHGNWNAQYKLGDIYSKGVPYGGEPLSVEDVSENDKAERTPDLAEAFYWYQQAAQSGYPEGMLALGQCYASGAGVAKDQAAAIRWVKQAAEAGIAPALMWLGGACLEGVGGLHYSQAKMWFEKAISLNPNLASDIASRYLACVSEPNAEADAFLWWEYGANAGNMKCQLNVAACLLNGKGTIKNEVKADEWLERMLGQDCCSDYENVRQHQKLATHFMVGHLFPRNPTKGVYWLRRTASLVETSAASYQLGLAYATGCGVDQNKASAEDWLKRAIGEGGWGYGPRPNLLLAFFWILWRDEQKFSEAEQIFIENQDDHWGLSKVGLSYLQHIGMRAGQASLIDLWKAQQLNFHWAYELEADILLSYPHTKENLDLAELKLHQGLGNIEAERLEGWYIGDLEVHRLQSKLVNLGKIKPLGLFARLVTSAMGK